MSKWKSILIAVTLFVFEGKLVFGQSRFDSLTKSLQQVFLKDSLPGMSVMLVNSDGVLYEQNFGFANAEKKIKYTSRSIQNIGSVSKTFAAIAVMKAVELGYFNLESSINDILPFRVVNPKDTDGVITVRNLCDHTSGIVDNPAIYPNSYHFNPKLDTYSDAAFNALKSLGYNQEVTDSTMKDLFYDYLSEKGKYYHPENFGAGKPGSTSSYSNMATALAAYLIELKSGMSYADFTTKFILKPLGMNDSGWFLDAGKLNRYAKPYFDKQSAFPFYQLTTYPEGGLRTDANDLGKYLSAVIKGFNGDDVLLTKASYKAMFTPQFSAEHPPKGISLVNRNKAIFWNIYTNGTIGHDGDDPSVSSFLFFNTQTGQGGLFLCNKYLPDKKPIIDLLVNFTK